MGLFGKKVNGYVIKSRANLGGANLINANLARANLARANLTEAFLIGAKYHNTTMPDGSIKNPAK